MMTTQDKAERRECWECTSPIATYELEFKCGGCSNDVHFQCLEFDKNRQLRCTDCREGTH